MKFCERGVNPRQRIYGRNEIPDSEQIERTGRSPKVKFCERGVNPRQRIYGRNEIPDSEQIERTGRSPKVKFCERGVNPRQFKSFILHFGGFFLLF